MASASKGRKGRVGKKKGWIAAYYNSGQNLWNKARKITKHLRRFPADAAALKARNVALAGLSQARTRDFNKLYG